MTPDIEQIIERLQDSDYRDDAIDDAISALRAVQWRPISEAKQDGNQCVVAVPSNRLYEDKRDTYEVRKAWGDAEVQVLHALGALHLTLPPLPTPRASKEA